MRDKNNLRQLITIKRKQASLLTPSSAIIKSDLFNHEIWTNAKHIGIYLAFGSEFPTKKIIELAWQQGKHIYLPICQKNHSMVFSYYAKEMVLNKNPLGMHEIASKHIHAIEPILLDICLVPGLVYDRFGGRYGYGAGYYDRFLPKLRKDCHIIACGYECQFTTEKLDLLPTDFIMPKFLSEKAFYETIPFIKNQHAT